jgi:hypothetical protein
MKPSVLVTKIQNVLENLDDSVFQSVNRNMNIYSIYTEKSNREIGSKIIFQMSGLGLNAKVNLTTQKTCEQLDIWLYPIDEEIETGATIFNNYEDFLEKYPKYDFLQDLLDLIDE